MGKKIKDLKRNWNRYKQDGYLTELKTDLEWIKLKRNTLPKLNVIKYISNIEVTLTVISVIGTLSNVLFAYLTFRRADRKEATNAGKNEATLIPDIGYIKSSTERIEERLDNSHTDLHTRVVVLGSEAKNLLKKRQNNNRTGVSQCMIF